MRIPFTKMQGAGNDFVVLDETRTLLGLTTAQYRFLGDRHFGVGADQILSVRAAPGPGLDFEYVIHNADGQQVEHCGNGARCFLAYVHQRGMTDKDTVTVKTLNRVLELRRDPDGRVSVDMGEPVFAPASVPFHNHGLQPHDEGNWQTWNLPLPGGTSSPTVRVAVLSMGNPHAVTIVDDVETADVAGLGPRIVQHERTVDENVSPEVGIGDVLLHPTLGDAQVVGLNDDRCDIKLDRSGSVRAIMLDYLEVTPQSPRDGVKVWKLVSRKPR